MGISFANAGLAILAAAELTTTSSNLRNEIKPQEELAVVGGRSITERNAPPTSLSIPSDKLHRSERLRDVQNLLEHLKSKDLTVAVQGLDKLKRSYEQLDLSIYERREISKALLDFIEISFKRFNVDQLHIEPALSSLGKILHTQPNRLLPQSYNEKFLASVASNKMALELLAKLSPNADSDLVAARNFSTVPSHLDFVDNLRRKLITSPATSESNQLMTKTEPKKD